MRRRDVEGEHFNESGQSGRLPFGEVEHHPRQRRRVDDGMRKRAFQPTTDEPGVECIVAVLHEDGALREAQERTPSVFELGGSDEHRAVDVVPPAGVRIDGSSTVHERVEERKGAGEPKPLGPDLQDQEGCIPGRLHVQGDEFGIVKTGFGAHLWRVDRDLFPGHRPGGASGLEEERLRLHRTRASARRAKPISSTVTARNTRAAPT